MNFGLRHLVALGAVFLAAGAVGRAQQARVRSAPQVSMPKPVDSNSPAFWRDGKLHWIGSHGYPWMSVGPGQFGPWENKEVWIESAGNQWPKWIEAVAPDEGKLWGWYHAEPRDLVPGTTLTVPRIGAVLSLDDGETFADLGVILASGEPLNPQAENGYFAGGHGDFSVILDRERRYFYFFFDNYGGAVGTQGVCLARMAYEDRANPEGKVWKYHDGAWTEAGVGGRVTPIFPVKRSWAARDPDALWGPSVHWNTHLNCYVMLLNRALGTPGWSQEGIYVSFSTDLSRPEAWTAPVKILGNEEFSGWYFFYPQVMGLEPGGTDRRAGQVARLYVNGISKWEIEFTAPATAPGSLQIAAFPSGGTVVAGQPLALSVAPVGEPPFTYQWFKDGAPVAGATADILEMPVATVAHAGAYHVAVTNALGVAVSNLVTVRVSVPASPVPPPAPQPVVPESFLSNLSVRATIGRDGHGLNVGFVLRGEAAKLLLVRAIGPALRSFGMSDAVADPRLTLYSAAGAAVAGNDDWRADDADFFARLGAFALSAGSADAAVAFRAPGGAGTAVVEADAGGVVLAEIYVPSSSAESKIVNLSARARAGEGDEALIGGFAVSGSGRKRLLVRALGPELARYGVADVLADPLLEIYDAAGARLATNDHWPAELAAAFAAAGAPALVAGSFDAAVVIEVPAGAAYTAVVRSGSPVVGEALLEIYELP